MGRILKDFCERMVRMGCCWEESEILLWLALRMVWWLEMVWLRY